MLTDSLSMLHCASGCNVRIHHECEGGIENPPLVITVWNHEVAE